MNIERMMGMNRKGEAPPPCLIFLGLAAVFLIVMMIAIPLNGTLAPNKNPGWASLKITAVAFLPGNQATAVTDDGSIYFLESRRGDKTSGQALYHGLKVGKVNSVHVASWMRRQNGRWLYVIDQMADSASPPESGAKPVVEESDAR